MKTLVNDNTNDVEQLSEETMKSSKSSKGTKVTKGTRAKKAPVKDNKAPKASKSKKTTEITEISNSEEEPKVKRATRKKAVKKEPISTDESLIENDTSNDSSNDINAIIDQVKTPKKRGRKPKGGKLVKTNIPDQEPVVEKKAIIMHLKCQLSDLNNSNHNENINQFDVYNPNNIHSIEPYEDNTTFTYVNNTDQNTDDEKHQTNHKCSEYEIIEKSNDSKQNVKDNQSIKKHINRKLKELEKTLNNNFVDKKSACFWCTCDFNSNTIYIPSCYYKERYDVYGCFCSPECACSYLFKENIDNNTKFERYQLLNYVYGKVYNYTKNIKPAPNPYYTLSKYYGNFSIQEYRQLLEFDRLILVIDKPLTKVYPELHEDNNEFETIYENKISLKKKSKVNKNEILNNVFKY